MRYYELPLEAGQTHDDAGSPVVWVACPALPGAYEEAADLATARARLRDLARRILAEHLLRDDPLDPAIVPAERPRAEREALLIVGVGDADLAAAAAAPRLVVEQPEP